MAQASPIAGGSWIGPHLWRTLRLYDRGVAVVPAGYQAPWARVLDYLALDVSDPTYGRVNPNSEFPEVLAAVFNDMPIDDLPNGLTDRLTPLQAADLAEVVQNHTYTNPIAKLSDLGHANLASAIFTELGIDADSELKKEAFYRNCPGMMHTRQNLFLILLAAQTANNPETFGPPDGVARTDQRAMAIVWRDPIPDPTTHEHKCFVRWFTWLQK